MSKHLQTGKEGEEMAEEWLKEKGYEIVQKNWRYSYYEIDIIASKGGILHFIEVKTRRSLTYGFPEEAVTFAKLTSMMSAGAAYLDLFSDNIRVQYDVLSILIKENGKCEALLFEDLSL
jgi:putative endonuclease